MVSEQVSATTLECLVGCSALTLLWVGEFAELILGTSAIYPPTRHAREYGCGKQPGFRSGSRGCRFHDGCCFWKEEDACHRRWWSYRRDR